MPRQWVPEPHPLVETVAHRLRARGERMTRPRRAVLAALTSSDGHLSADQVAAAVADGDARVHRSSVYRALDALVSLGVVQHVHVERGIAAYHVASGGRPHLHAHCRACDAVLDLPADLLDDVATVLGSEHGFVLDASHVALSGWCEPCR